jgi:hypothetical protein
MKKVCTVVDIATTKVQMPSISNTVIIATYTLNSNINISELETYVNNGGKVIIGVIPYINNGYQSLYRKLGIYDFGENVKIKGVRFKEDFLINSKGMSFEGEFIDGISLDARIESKCNVYVESYDKLPVIWDVEYGKGKFLVVNSDMLVYKSNRGVLSGALMAVNDNYIYPIFNMRLMHIDDFPAPSPEGYNEQILKDYRRDVSEFFRDVWWPDIMQGIFKYDIKYTGYIIESYSDKVQEPFYDSKFDNRNLVMYGRELLKNNGELGFHGYNHMPYAMEGFAKFDIGYTPWLTGTDMILSMKEFQRYVNSAFPNYKVRCYVAPSNIISPEGRTYLKKGFPDISIISASYIPDETADEYEQEFEISDSGHSNMPRITSGYHDLEEERWLLINGITSIGTMSHFVHPDDVLDDERNNGLNWETMLKEYNTFLDVQKEKYPWLKPLTSSEGEVEMKKLLDSKIYLDYEKDKIYGYCDNFYDNLSFVLKTNNKVISVNGGRVEKIDNNKYLFYAEKSQFNILLGE